jgi:hypothetical protein
LFGATTFFLSYVAATDIHTEVRKRSMHPASNPLRHRRDGKANFDYSPAALLALAWTGSHPQKVSQHMLNNCKKRISPPNPTMLLYHGLPTRARARLRACPEPAEGMAAARWAAALPRYHF